MLELQNDNLKDILNSSEKTFVMFGATWCGACKMTKPKVKRMAGENESIQFVYVDAEFMTESRSLAGKIDNLPTFVAFKNSDMISKEPGAKSIDVVLESLS